MLKERIRGGLLVGLVMATMYSAWILLLYLVAKRPPPGRLAAMISAITAFFTLRASYFDALGMHHANRSR
jgi:hypothetical protein